MKILVPLVPVVLLGSFVFASTSIAQTSEDDLAKQLANPISSLISLPIQVNHDKNYGAADQGSVTRTNIQPVIPFSIGENWNVISRTILPVINQDDVPTVGLGESGIGDILQSFFFSPKALTASGWTWGVGPVILLDSASDDALGAGQWGLGPTGVALKQTGPWTFGALVNHVVDVGGDDGRQDINASFVQPFLAYVTPTKTTFSVNSESTYDWESEQWSAPVNFIVSQMFRVGNQIMQGAVGARYWAESPDAGPDGWGYRAQLTFLFPR